MNLLDCNRFVGEMDICLDRMLAPAYGLVNGGGGQNPYIFLPKDRRPLVREFSRN